MTPDRHYEHKQHTFDSFCKKVLKCEAYNGYREISRKVARSRFQRAPEDSDGAAWVPMTGIPGNTLSSLSGEM